MSKTCVCGCKTEFNPKNQNQRFKDEFHRWNFANKNKKHAVMVLSNLKNKYTPENGFITIPITELDTYEEAIKEQ